ncbi:PIN domain nuclease [Nonomuraea sp. NPDC003804]|uniref:PIN domain nuclease n=1 Tax=Nonomuraea sp. NPDC003804 TaxID=3154547 RepID=UPI0033B75F5D
MEVTCYLGDKSALARLHMAPVRARLAPLITRGLVSICAPTQLELLYSARGPADYAQLKSQLDAGFPWMPIPDRGWQRACEIQESLAKSGKHRGPSIADLLIAVTAEAWELTVLHYDRDFETIAEVTQQPTEWVVPAGAAEAGPG